MRFQPRPTTERLSVERPPRERERAPTRDRAINTKVVGVRPRGTTEANEIGNHRQKVLEYIQNVGERAFDGVPPDYWLKLKEEPSNSYDSDAIKVMLHSRTAHERGRTEGVHVGHIANGERVCTNATCGIEYERPHSAGEAILVCTSCGSPTKRDGLASQLKARATEASRSVEDHYNVTIAWDAGGVTGGGVRTHGCNIRVQARG